MCLSPALARADIMEAVRADRWAEATTEAAALPDPVAAKLVLFYRLLAPHAASLAEIEGFASAHPDWPMGATLARRRDEALAAEPDDAAAAASCGRAAPASPEALARCAEATQAAGQDGTIFARAAWVAANPDPAWDASFLARWSAAIGPAEQWRRFDRLAWGDSAAASGILSALNAADRAAGAARLALRHNDPAALPEAAIATHDPGLVLDELRWLRRAGRVAEAAAFWGRAGQDAERDATGEHRGAFWDERQALARLVLRQGDAAAAFALVTQALPAAPEQAAEADFLAGWIALRRLSDPAGAQPRFAALAASPSILTRSRARYWLARCAEASGDAGAGALRTAAAVWPTSYYGQLAIGNDDLVARILAARDPSWTGPQAVDFAGRELARAAAYLVAWGERRRAGIFLVRLAEVAPAPVDLALAAHLATGFGLPETATAVARKAGRAGTALPETGWPVGATVPADSPVEPALALAVMRQESSFDPGTLSPAGARGLMQLMPATAAAVGRGLGVAASPAALSDPTLNIRLGTAYLRQMLDRFAGSVPLALAAYNAGPSRVADWLAQNGDPRTGAIDIVDWIELIPLAETRNYVQRVIENAAVYRARLGGRPA